MAAMFSKAAFIRMPDTGYPFASTTTDESCLKGIFWSQLLLAYLYCCDYDGSPLSDCFYAAFP
jgi:hypothetical protein